jgi:hypothetical protein
METIVPSCLSGHHEKLFAEPVFDAMRSWIILLQSLQALFL